MRNLNPIPSSTKEKNNGSYSGDSGIDILVAPGTPVVCPADGEIIYSEWGHTPWVPTNAHPKDTPYSILVRLKEPVVDNGKTYPYLWFTHLAHVTKIVPDGGRTVPVKRGEVIGATGIGNDVPHLHFGIIANRAQSRPEDWMPPHRVIDYVWSKRVPGKDNLTVVFNDGKGLGETVPCHPLLENGVTRVDLRPVVEALGFMIDSKGLDDGVLVIHKP